MADIAVITTVVVIATIAVDYFMFSFVGPRIFKRALDRQAAKYNPRSEGLNIDLSYNQDIAGVSTELFGVHLRGQNISSIIDTFFKMISGKKRSPEFIYQDVEKVLKDDHMSVEEKLKKIIDLTR